MTGTDQSWDVTVYGSGSTTVSNGRPNEPYLYVVVQSPLDGDGGRLRYAACVALAAFLNGGPRPAWLDDMERCGPDELVAADGTSIQAAGPMYDRDPPNCIWWRREDAAAKAARFQLINRLVEWPS